MGQADPILTRLGASTTAKKCIETAIGLSNSKDPQQRNLAYSFMETAIKELEDDEEKKIHEEEEDDDEKTREEKMGMHGDKDGLSNHKIGEEEDDRGEKRLHEERDDENKDHKIHEEELSNHNQGQRTTGSEQSTENTEPYRGEGKDTTNGEKPMQDMDDTVNQWSETNGGMIMPGMPPTPEMGGMPTGAPPPNDARTRISTRDCPRNGNEDASTTRHEYKPDDETDAVYNKLCNN